MDRGKRIRYIIKHWKYDQPNIKPLAAELGFSKATIQKDVKLIREATNGKLCSYLTREEKIKLALLK